MLNRITEQPFCQTRVSGSTFVNADCFDVFPFIEDKSIDAIICDLPYGTTACKWDSVLPFDKLWEQYERIIKPNGAIILFGSQPFTSALIMSNTWLNDSAPKQVFKEKDLQLLMFEQRIKYNDNNKITFSSSYYCFNFLPKQIIMERLS